MATRKKEPKAAPRQKAVRICPDCKGRRVRRIEYGDPSPELAAKAERGEVVLGGCVIDELSPRFACLDCGNQFGRPALAYATAEEWYLANRGRMPLILVGHVDALMKSDGLTLEQAYRKLVGEGRIIEIPGAKPATPPDAEAVPPQPTPRARRIPPRRRK